MAIHGGYKCTVAWEGQGLALVYCYRYTCFDPLYQFSILLTKFTYQITKNRQKGLWAGTWRTVLAAAMGIGSLPRILIGKSTLFKTCREPRRWRISQIIFSIPLFIDCLLFNSCLSVLASYCKPSLYSCSQRSYKAIHELNLHKVWSCLKKK